MKYIKSPEPKWLNSHLLYIDIKTVLKVSVLIATALVGYYAAVHQLIGDMPLI